VVARVSGTVSDTSGAAVAAARVTIKEVGTGTTQSVDTHADGTYELEHLLPATYEIEASRPGFGTVQRRVSLRVGDSATLDFELKVGAIKERVDVAAGSAQVNRIDSEVAGIIERAQIEHLPINGRSFLELAQLQPTVDVVSVTNPGALGNNYQRVQVAGAYYSQTRISVDGATIGDRFFGGTMQGFSQESVQEFQIATFSLDPAIGVAGSGRSTSSRSGAPTTFMDRRSGTIAATISRPIPGSDVTPATPSPFFARRQSGVSLGGPLRHDALFWFANYEHNDQDAVFLVANNHPIFSKFDGLYPNPLTSRQFDLRLDGRLSQRRQAFLRFGTDANDTTAPAVAVGLPSNWQAVRNRAFQIHGGLMSVLTPHLVNDLRLSTNYLGGDLDPMPSASCTDPLGCVGVGGPNILVFDAPQFRIGNQANSPFDRWQRTLQLVESITWQKGNHRLRAGVEWEHPYIKANLAFNEPAQVTLWGPTNLQTPAFMALYDGLPASLRDSGAPAPTISDLLQLPLRSLTTGIGDPLLPGTFNFDSASRNDLLRFYVQDGWRLRLNLTLSYGLAYSFETNLFAHDLPYPSYLSPIIGGDLSAPKRDLNNFDPSLSLVWAPGRKGKTVVRAGGGVYHDQGTVGWKARERAFIGPSGNARVVVDGSVAGLSFTSTPTDVCGEDLLPLLPALRADLTRRVGNGTNVAISGIDVVKQGDQIVDPSATTAYSIQANGGVQRELGRGFILTADYVLRRYVHVGPLQGVYSIDRNRFNRPRVTGVDAGTGAVSFVRDPIIPVCSFEQSIALSANDDCSTGPINMFASGANFRYQGVHIEIEKRYDSRRQFTLGYAFSHHSGFIDGGFTSYDDYRLAYGTIPNNRRHRLTMSSVWTPPNYTGSVRVWRALLNSWTVSVISHTFSAPPLNTLLSGLDLDGDGISLTLLPGPRGTTAWART
jgi:hypothetical protein